MNKTPYVTPVGFSIQSCGPASVPSIVSPRGLIAVMAAGNQAAREEDAQRIVATLEAFPAVLAALKELYEYEAQRSDYETAWERTMMRNARNAIELTQNIS